MNSSLEEILVVDVEATCWRGAPPPGQASEIIEIGLCVVDVTTRRPGAKHALLVRPERSEVSAFCTELTSLTPAQVADARPFADAVEALMEEHASRQRLWASWGDYDRGMFERQCRELGTPYPFGPAHLNVKTLFALAEGLPRGVGLGRAYRKWGWGMEGTHHRGVDDAHNIARVLCRLLERLGSVPGN